MNRQAIVGLFTILGLLALFVIFFVLSNLGTGGRYKIGVHFKSASGIHRGALVYESGVNVGVVDSLELLPADFTVDVILAINGNVDIPRDARFIIQAPLTGDATLEIVPKAPVPRPGGLAAPTPPPGAVAVLPHEVSPIEQQPLGTNPATLTDLLEQGQGEVTRLDTLLADLEKREPSLLNTLQSALTNANELSITTNEQVQKLARTLDALRGPLGATLSSTTSRIVDLTARLDDLAKVAQPQVVTLLTSFNDSAAALNDTVNQLHDLAKNPQLRANLIDTTRYLAQTSQTIAQLVGDFRTVTSNPQTQAQLRDTIANIDATTQRANSLLGELGGTSDVYGVDALRHAARGDPGRDDPAGVGQAVPRASAGAGRGTRQAARAAAIDRSRPHRGADSGRRTRRAERGRIQFALVDQRSRPAKRYQRGPAAAWPHQPANRRQRHRRCRDVVVQLRRAAVDRTGGRLSRRRRRALFTAWPVGRLRQAARAGPRVARLRSAPSHARPLRDTARRSGLRALRR